MKTENKNQQAQSSQPVQGFISNPQVYLNEERGTLTHVLTDGKRTFVIFKLQIRWNWYQHKLFSCSICSLRLRKRTEFI